MLKIWILLFTLPFATVLTDQFSDDCIAMDGVGDKKAVMYKGSCLVAHSTALTFSVAGQSCNDFEHGGHLAFVTTLNDYNAITTAFPGVIYFIGLKHGTSADIKTDWWWIKSDQEKYEALADLTPWDTSNDQPDGSATPATYGYIYDGNPSITNTNSTQARQYLCQYGHTYRHTFKAVEGGRIPPSTSVIGNHTDIPNQSKCGSICGKNTLCYSFAYDGNTKHCIIAPVPTDQIRNATLSTDYINFDKL